MGINSIDSNGTYGNGNFGQAEKALDSNPLFETVKGSEKTQVTQEAISPYTSIEEHVRDADALFVRNNNIIISKDDIFTKTASLQRLYTKAQKTIVLLIKDDQYLDQVDPKQRDEVWECVKAGVIRGRNELYRVLPNMGY